VKKVKHCEYFPDALYRLTDSKELKLTTGILLATSRAFCLAVSTAYSWGSLKSPLSRVSLNQDGTTSKRKPCKERGEEIKQPQNHTLKPRWIVGVNVNI